jgi:hypothetical protein
MAVRQYKAALRLLQCLIGDEGNIGDLAADLGYFVANDTEEARKTVEYRRRFYASRAEYIGEEIRTLGPEIRERFARAGRLLPSMHTPPSKRTRNAQPMPADVRDG